MQDILLERYIKEAISKEEELEKLFYEFIVKNNKNLNENFLGKIKDFASSTSNLERVLLAGIAGLLGFNMHLSNLTPKEKAAAEKVKHELQLNDTDHKAAHDVLDRGEIHLSDPNVRRVFGLDDHTRVSNEESPDYSRMVDYDTVSVEGEDGETYTMSYDEYDYFLNLNADRETHGNKKFEISEYIELLEFKKQREKEVQEAKDFVNNVLSYDEDGTPQVDYDNIVSEKDDIKTIAKKFKAISDNLNFEASVYEEREQEVPRDIENAISDIESVEDVLYQLNIDGSLKDGGNKDLVQTALNGENNKMSDESLSILIDLIGEDNLD